VNNSKPATKITMPVKAKPYRHQIEAFNFVCGMFGFVMGVDANEHFQESRYFFTYGNGLTQAPGKPSPQ
jgi:hypothetical protein